MSNPTPLEIPYDALQALLTGFGNVYELLPCPPMQIEAGTFDDLLAELERLEQEEN